MATNPNQQQFHNLFIESLQDIYSAEDQLIKALPGLIEILTTEEFKKNLNANLENMIMQKESLLQIFKELNAPPTGTFCEGMKGLLTECNKIAKEDFPGVVKDVALIHALQKCKHYEIATYSALQTFAKHLGHPNIQIILQEILEDEWNSDKSLTTMAESGWTASGIQ